MPLMISCMYLRLVLHPRESFRGLADCKHVQLRDARFAVRRSLASIYIIVRGGKSERTSLILKGIQSDTSRYRKTAHTLSVFAAHHSNPRETSRTLQSRPSSPPQHCPNKATFRMLEPDFTQSQHDANETSRPAACIVHCLIVITAARRACGATVSVRRPPELPGRMMYGDPRPAATMEVNCHFWGGRGAEWISVELCIPPFMHDSEVRAARQDR